MYRSVIYSEQVRMYTHHMTLLIDNKSTGNAPLGLRMRW